MIGLFKNILGNKSQRDIKAIDPILTRTLESYEVIKTLSNDQLREKTSEFRQKIKEYIAGKEQEIADLKIRLNSDEVDIEEKENLYNDLDRLEKESYDLTQQILDELLPEAFSVIKDTARRFFENDYIEVTASQMDRDLAAIKDNVEIVGDKARYSSSWMAGGNMIRWDMIHYDVQLIGGIV